MLLLIVGFKSIFKKMLFRQTILFGHLLKNKNKNVNKFSSVFGIEKIVNHAGFTGGMAVFIRISQTSNKY